MELERMFLLKFQTFFYFILRTTIVAKSIKATNPDVKLFMFLTDPIDRLRSHIKMCVRSKSQDCLSEVRVYFINYLCELNYQTH